MSFLNTKALLITVFIAGGIAGILGIAQIWFNLLDWELFIKIMVTIGVIGLLAGFLIAVDYDMPASKQKLILSSSVFMAVLTGALLLAQMWWALMEWVTFAKIMGTILILFVLVSFIAAAREDLGTNKKLKDENYLD